MKRRQVLQQLQLTSDVVQVLSKITVCDCGKPAKHIGVFYVTNIMGHVRRDALLLCDECARLVDEGVTVTALK